MVLLGGDGLIGGWYPAIKYPFSEIYINRVPSITNTPPELPAICIITQIVMGWEVLLLAFHFHFFGMGLGFRNYPYTVERHIIVQQLTIFEHRS